MRNSIARLALSIAATLSLATSCDQGIVVEDYELRGTLSSENIPAGIDAAVERMYGLFPEATNDALIRCENNPPETFCREFYAKIGMRLRMLVSNEWMRAENSPLAAAYVGEGITNPEEMSYALMDAYVDFLTSVD